LRHRVGFILAGLLALGTFGAGSAAATFPGSNGRIAFSVLFHRSGQILTMNPDGTGRTRLISTRHANYSPTWSADGSKLAYLHRIGPTRLITMNADGTGRNVILERSHLWDPAWSRDGTQIVLRQQDGHVVAPELVIVNVDGSGTTVLPNSSDDWDPEWSPDGTLIAFNHRFSSIMTMSPDGTHRSILTEVPSASDPSWSPDGSHIVFAAGLYQTDLYTVDAASSELVQLTDTPRRLEFSPAWSPDGTQIVFDRWVTVTRATEICVRDSDGSNEVKLTDTRPRDETGPSWQAVG
jgi:Tol biopolymer transport system component